MGLKLRSTPCMQNDGTHSWIVISRGDVTELQEGSTTPIHYEHAAPGGEKPVAMKQQEQFIPSSSSSSSTVMPINKRRWNDSSAVGRSDEKSLKISKQMTDYCEIKVILEKMMEQLNGEGCYFCSVVITLTQPNGRCKCGQSVSREEVTRTYFSIAWTLMATLSTCVLSKATLEGTKLILHCKITCKFLTIGFRTSITLVPFMIALLSSNQVSLQ